MVRWAEKWAHAALVDQFGVASLTQVSPEALKSWAMEHSVQRYLP